MSVSRIADTTKRALTLMVFGSMVWSVCAIGLPMSQAVVPSGLTATVSSLVIPEAFAGDKYGGHGVPEIDGDLAVQAIGLLAGALLLMRSGAARRAAADKV